ncbi:MAG TPA: GPP34 family phosphoprotein [Streptomyces sp.]|nr:GPP34 family phosphoprotein [Streptomyces sp.]
MSTARDLLIIALGKEPDAPVERGDLSLALAGAELIDLLQAGTVTLDGDRIVPGLRAATGDRLLDEAASALVGQEPYESVEDWLWRRGRDLSSAHLTALEKEGLLTRARGRIIPVPTGRSVPADSPARDAAEERRASGEPVFASLSAAAGIGEEPVDGSWEHTDDAVVAVLAAVGDAVMELEGVRQQRTIENAAYDNVWRGL